MNADVRNHDQHHRMGYSATRPIRPRCGALAALLLLAGTSPQRRRALPAHPIAARSGASNCGFQDDPLPILLFDPPSLDADQDFIATRA